MGRLTDQDGHEPHCTIECLDDESSTYANIITHGRAHDLPELFKVEVPTRVSLLDILSLVEANIDDNGYEMKLVVARK